MFDNQLPASFFAPGNQLLGTNTVPNPFLGIITHPTQELPVPGGEFGRRRAG
jgi:hypothetical protein